MTKMQEIMKNLVIIHSQLTEHQCCTLIVGLVIKVLQVRKSLRSLRWVSAAEDQTQEQYSKQGRIKEPIHLNEES